MLAAEDNAGYPEATHLSADQGALFSGLTLSTDESRQSSTAAPSADEPTAAAQSAESVAATASTDEPATTIQAADMPTTIQAAEMSSTAAPSADEPTAEAQSAHSVAAAAARDETATTIQAAEMLLTAADESAQSQQESSVAASSTAAGLHHSAASAPADEPIPVSQVAQSLTAAPIASLSRVALQETFAELAASARSTAAASSAAIRRLRNGAERSLGIEVSIEDPALRDLFGHILQVEALLDQLKQQAAAVCNGAALLAESQSKVAWSPCMEQAGKQEQTRRPASSSLSEKLATLSPELVLDGTGAELQRCLDEASWTTLSLSPNAGEQGSARYCLERRLQEEVLDHVEAQLRRHDDIRDRIRQRQCWQEQVAKCQVEILAIKKGVSSWSGMVANIGGNLASAAPRTGQEEGLKLQGPGYAASRIEALDEELTQAQAKVSSIDAEVLAELLELQAEARGIVAKPWAAFARIRTEFFRGMASGWAPMATELGAARPGLQSFQPPSV
eukprot:TRINITY_DN63675_c0_g1_i1.p1 TRINITY_DN63675_c0_g1~~TRINITY_DN63675_c0_g1_i1.p1  ORF type:complete len:507 (+),score=117.70 TRINITY_DN63675_c0_g1_i1:43-1563(+)